MTPQDAGSLTCPKCGAPMRSDERNRVLVEQCTGCGGLFLDRGELESLVAAEQAWHASRAGASAGVAGERREERDDRRYDDRPRYDERRYDERRYDERRYDERRYDDRPRYDDRHRHGKKKKSFLSELFDD